MGRGRERIDYQAGRDFKLTKTKRGQYADYSTSNWSMRTRSLSEDEEEAINDHGLFDLKYYLPKEPRDRDLEVIKEMFQASVDGEEYDPDRWSAHYRPAGFRGAENNSDVATSPTKSTPKTPKTKAAVEEIAKEIAEEIKETPSSPKAALSKLKQRVNAVKEDTTSNESTPDEETSNTEGDKPDHTQILEMIKKRRKTS